MAVSDNVLNAAFTPQPPPEDRWQVRAFLDALTYTARSTSHWILPPKPFTGALKHHTNAYDPPEKEFSVLGTALRAQAGEDAEEFAPCDGPLVGIVVRGKVKVKVGDEEMVLQKGGVVYVRPGNAVQVKLLQAQRAQQGEGDQPDGEVWWAACFV